MKSFLVLFQIFFFINVQAEEMSLGSILNLNEQVYSASRKVQEDREAPQVVTIITPKQMKRFGFRTINEALQMVPGFDVQRQMRKEFVWTRGVRESALILINSIPIMNPNDNEAILDKAFNIEMIDRVEVLRGPGGVLWGNNAFLGIVNVITKKAKKSEDLFEVNGHYASFEQRKVGLVASQDFGDLSYFISGHTWRGQKHDVEVFNNYNDGTRGGSQISGVSRQDESRWDDVYANISYKDWSFSYKRDDHREYTPLTDLQTFVIPEGGNPFYEDDETELFQLTKSGKLSDGGSYMFRGQVLNRDTVIRYPQRATGTPDVDILLNGMEVTVYTADIQVNEQVSENHDIVWGATYQHVEGGKQPIILKQNGTVTRQDNYFQAHAKFTSISGFFQSTYKMSDRWNLGGGLRLEYTDAVAERRLSSGSIIMEDFNYDPTYIVNLNSIHKVGKNDSLKFIFSKGIRRPDVEQSTGGETFVGNTDLKDESALSFEIDYLKDFSGKVTWRNNISLTHVSDLIDFKPNNSGSFVAGNLDDADIYVLESEVKWTMKNDSFLLANLTYKTGETEDDIDFSIIGTNQWSFNILNSYSFTNKWSVNTYISYVGTKEDYFAPNRGAAPISNPSRKEVDDYVNVDLGFYGEGIVKDLDMSFFIYNLLDEEYFHQNRFTKTGYLHPRPGRNYAVNIYYKF